MPDESQATTTPENPHESLIRQVFDQIQISLAYLNTTGDFVLVNSVFAEGVGVAPQDLIGKNAFALINPNPQGREIFDRVLRTGQAAKAFSVPFDDPNHPERPTIYLDWSLQPIKTADGVIAGMLFTSQNVTGRENARKALEETQALFQLLFESAPDANILVNEQGTILAINTRTEQMFGYSRAELVGNKIEMLLPARYNQSHPRLRGGYIQSPHMRAMGAGLELFAQRRNGEEFSVDVILSPFKTETGLLVLGVVRDITARKRMQAELDEVQHKLHHQAELERMHLARELHDGPIQELYGLSFQLNELAERYPHDSQMVVQVRTRLQETITALRAIMSALRPPTLTPFGLERTIRSHAEGFSKLNPLPVLHLDLERDGQRLPEETRLALFRIYQETLNNALRHAQANNFYVQLALHDRSVELTIQDDGIGFEVPHRWVQMPREGHFGLVGIRERVEALDGRLQLESTPGRGTRFHIVAPIAEQAQQSPPQAAQM